MWTDDRALIEALIQTARNSVEHDFWFLKRWRDYAYGLNPDSLSKEQAIAALDWLQERLDMPVNPDA